MNTIKSKDYGKKKDRKMDKWDNLFGGKKSSKRSMKELFSSNKKKKKNSMMDRMFR